jgi:hypothetical protein
VATDVQFEILVDGTWRNLTARDQVRAAQAVTVKRAAAGVGEAPRPSVLTAQLDNTDDGMRPSNPESDLYETAGVGTQIRVTRNGDVRGYVQAQSWVADETSDFRRFPKRGAAWVDVTGAGLLDQAVSSPRLASPFTRYAMARASLLAVWPCEEESGATALTNLSPGGRSGRVTGGVTFGSDERPPGSERVIQTPAGTGLSGVFPTADATLGWRISFQARIPATLTGSYLPIFTFYDSTGRRWTWEVNNTDHALRVVDADLTAIVFDTVARPSTADQWCHFYVTAVVSAGTLSYEAYGYTDDGTGGAGNTGTFSTSTTGSLRSWSRPDNTYTADAYYSQIYGLSDAGDVGAEYLAFAAHRAEPAGWRFARLMEELGFAWSWVGDPDDTIPMGPQQADTLAEMLREIQDTEDGLIYDKRDALEIVMKTRASRINQTPLSMHVTDLVARPKEVTDTAIANTVTASGRLDAEAVTVDVSGPLGVTAKGVLERQVKVNVYPDRFLDSLANWYLRRWTVNQPRYPTVTVKLNALNPVTAGQIAALDIGDVLQITGLRHDVVRLHILAIDEVIEWPNAHLMVFTCEPDDLFNSGVYGSVRYDSASTTLAATAEIGATSLSLTTSLYGDRLWSTTATPYDLMIGGERVTVTSMPAPTGSGPWTHTPTVARSRNGVRKRLPAGAEVHVADRGRYALSGE